MAAETEPQRIARLTPLAAVLARIDAQVQPVAPREVALAAALGRTLAEDAVAPSSRPATTRALRDGFAVSAETTADASSYMPMPLAAPAPVDTGDVLPAGADAVAPVDIVVVARGGGHEIVAPVAPGDGVLAAGSDMAAGASLRGAGQRLRNTDIAVMAAAGLTRVAIREPRIRLLVARGGDDPVLAAARDMVARAIAAEGGALMGDNAGDADLAAALASAEADAIIAIGGTGSGRHDGSVRTLAQHGTLETHGIAIMPGGTAAVGFVGHRPVLLLPGRIDASVAAWLLLGRHLLARLSGSDPDGPEPRARLTRKVASPLGMTEVVPVRRRGSEIEPIASGYWPLRAITEADGWILIAPDSEGYPAGSEVVIRPWP